MMSGESPAEMSRAFFWSQSASGMSVRVNVTFWFASSWVKISQSSLTG